jgi:hypothetical protein
MDRNENLSAIAAAGLTLHESGPNRAANPNGRRTRSFRLTIGIGGGPSAAEFPARFEAG